MFEKEIDEIYGLCKRVVHEVPTADVVFDYSACGLRVCALKDRNDIFTKTEEEFHYDIHVNIFPNSPILADSNWREYEKIKAFLLELLTERKCSNE